MVSFDWSFMPTYLDRRQFLPGCPPSLPLASPVQFCSPPHYCFASVFPLPPPLTHYSALPCTCPKRFFWAPAFCTPGHIGENSVSYPPCRKLSTLYVMSVLYNEVNIFGINITYLLTTYLLNKQKTFFFLHIVICYLNISHINVFFFFCLYPHC